MSVLYLARHSDIFSIGRWFWPSFSICTIGVSDLYFSLSIYVRYGVCRVGMILHAVYNYKGGCLLDTRTIDQDQRCLDGITSLLND
ncbi:hypothetical protein BDQ94DRAFT_10101 [Aspergillus welwitschiae]|uniref:Uncharacterized protein n=1 Tax=Aspergillus welwitschiae TaxID=1341132 RepID=A0A3F3Q7T3_9EURO|nr:hypothetical protein BDQ94DRAFT_10101 [Aspergillus welwitschiae]RDH35179.1 hypothetical protein BDQ94DRAFT_10101 [Aspergillus welwitschiae]